MNKNIDKRLDVIYTTVDVLMNGGCWQFLDEHLTEVATKAWRLDVIELIAYATATLPGKSKLPNRKNFISHCKRLFPEGGNWKGLE